jgi:hypothetical protein
MIDIVKQLYDATHDGLDIIVHYYPDARECAGKTRGFKMHDEKTASSYLKKFNDGIWKATNFGDDSHVKSPLDIAMKVDNLTFAQALAKWTEIYHIKGIRLDRKINYAVWNKRQPETVEERDDKYFRFDARIGFTDFELNVFGSRITAEIMTKLGWKAVLYYEFKSDKNEIWRVSSTDSYPIYLRECHTDDNRIFYKMYQPYALPNDKGQSSKFAYYPKGDKSKDYINGLYEIKNECKKRGDEKLPEIIICSGERDAANCYAYGFFPVWLNSETADLPKSTYFELKKYAEKIYNIPDIDDTGTARAHKIATEYIDIRTVRLPNWLSDYRDMRGKKCKDLRDYLNLNPSEYEFKGLLATAMPYQIWEWVKAAKDTTRPEINTSYASNLLARNGFCAYKDRNGEIILVRVQGFVVEEVKESDVRNFLTQFVEKNSSDHKIWNLWKNTDRKKSIIEDLPIRTFDFCNNGYDHQYLFFENKTIKVTSKDIIEYKQREDVPFVWKSRIIPVRYERLTPTYEFVNKTEFKPIIGKSHFQRFLVNTSRTFWRNEMEKRAIGNPDIDNKYAKDNKFTLRGERLTSEEITEQLQNFMNKCYVMGYLMHKYKNPHKAWAVWVMEQKDGSEENLKSGGTGKSLTFEHTLKNSNLKKIFRKNGSDPELTKNKHIFDRVNAETDIFLLDDFAKYGNIEFLKTIISGSAEVNPKGTQSFELSFSETFKTVITSSFPPKELSGQINRRLLFTIFSDWYHNKVEGSDYLENRTVFDDFGININYGEQYTNEFWNEDINFLINCLQFYLYCEVNNIPKIDPPMKTLFEQMNNAVMGTAFIDWAEIYFDKGNGNINTEILKSECISAFYVASGLERSKFTTNRFTKAIKAFCKNNGYTFNPIERCNRDKGRIFNGNTEYYFIKTN